jgi:hypothetical protein
MIERAWRDAFLRDLDQVRVSEIGEATALGLFVTSPQEHTLHEYAHATSLGLRLTSHHRGRLLSTHIEHQIDTLSKKAQREDEYMALAAEILVLRRFNLVDDEEDFLFQIADYQADDRLPDHVQRRIRLCQYGTEDLARRTLRRIRDEARLRRKEGATSKE